MEIKFSYIYAVVVVTIIVISILMLGIAFWYENEGGLENDNNVIRITNFEECINAGYPVMESYPRQCAANGETYVEIIVNQNLNTSPKVLSAEAETKINTYTGQACSDDEECGPFPCNNGECLIKECTCSCNCPSSNCGDDNDEVPGYCQSVKR